MCDVSRVYPNSTAEQETQHTLAHADSHSGPVTVSFDAMALALELAALRSASDRASRREFALVLITCSPASALCRCHFSLSFLAAIERVKAGRLLIFCAVTCVA